MNPNDPLENPGAFFGNKAIKPKNMSQENNQHNHGYYNNSNNNSNSTGVVLETEVTVIRQICSVFL